jgi:hypothetical protein
LQQVNINERTALAASSTLVVVTGLFSLFLLRKHFITEKKFKKKSGDVNDEANFSLFILLHKRAKPILPPWARELKTLTSARVEPLAQ